MPKSKSKLTGSVSSPVIIMPPSMSSSTVISRPMLDSILDRRVLTNEERRNLTGSFPIDILYLKNITMGHRGNRMYLFMEERDVNNQIRLKLIPYQGVTDQSDHQNVIRAYQNLGYNVSNTVSNDMSWRFGRFIIQGDGQSAQIIINGMSPFTSNFVLAEANYSTSPPFTVNLKEVKFERRQRPNMPMGDLGVNYLSMSEPIRMRTVLNSGEIERIEGKMMHGNLIIVGALLIAGIYAYDKMKKK